MGCSVRRAVLFGLGCLAASGLAACRGRSLDQPDAGAGGAGTLVGTGGAAPAGGPGGGAGATGGSGGAAGAGGPGAGGTAGTSPPACQGGATVAYLVRGLASVERADGGLLLHGFDLDGRASDGTAPEDCRLADGMSPDGQGGIDNAIGGFWQEDFRLPFDTSYAQGNAPIVIRLSGVDDFDADACVDVEWSRAAWVGTPADPAAVQATSRELRLEGPVARLTGAWIEAGRLFATGDVAIELRALVGTRSLTFPVALSRLAFAVTAEGLADGALGGRVRPGDVHGAYDAVYGSMISHDLIAASLSPDLPSGAGPCALLSAGFGFDAVRVTIAP
jgi:hypothetical protein